MSRTVTGSYTLRPTYSSYRSSGTFSDWFQNTNAPSSWTSNMAVGTSIGDNSDSTYFNDTSVDTSTDAKNCVLQLDVTAGTVPAYDYTITKVTFYYRNKTSNSTNATRVFRIWNTIWDRNGNAGTPSSIMGEGRFGNMGFNGSTSSVSTGTTTVTTRSAEYTSLTNATMEGGLFPDRGALCIQAYKTSHYTSFSSYQLYDVWYVVEYTYQEPTDVTATFTSDDGCSIQYEGSTVSTLTAEEDSTVSLTAVVGDGYEFDGWYLNGSKVSSSTTYTFTMAAVTLYALTKVRKLYVGDAQVQEVYIGTTPAAEIYSGEELIWGPSPLYSTATGGSS